MGSEEMLLRGIGISATGKSKTLKRKGTAHSAKNKGIIAFSISCRRYALRQALQSLTFEILYSVCVWLDTEILNVQI